MINHLRHMAIFATVVDAGSFRAAAKDLGLAPSRTSDTVSELEKYLGVTLLYRTTRKLVLTNEGRRFYTHVSALLKNAEAGLNELNSGSPELVGELKISLPAFLASSAITSAIAAFSQQHQKVSISLNFSDQLMNMLSEGLDLSIRVGWLEDSSMMSRKIGESRRLLVASKSYAEGRPTATKPSDLIDWDWIRFSQRPSTVEFTSSAGKKVTISENARISADSTEAVCHLASQHSGLAILPEHWVVQRLNRQEFVHILPDWTLKPLGYYAVWPDKSRRESLTLQLVRFIAASCMTPAQP